jgi:hypothetical protein
MWNDQMGKEEQHLFAEIGIPVLDCTTGVAACAPGMRDVKLSECLEKVVQMLGNSGGRVDSQ